jgi:hypothetical protein
MLWLLNDEPRRLCGDQRTQLGWCLWVQALIDDGGRAANPAKELR